MLVAVSLGLLWRGHRTRVETRTLYPRPRAVARRRPRGRGATCCARPSRANPTPSIPTCSSATCCAARRPQPRRWDAPRPGGPSAARASRSGSRSASALVEDLVVLGHWTEAGDLLDELQRQHPRPRATGRRRSPRPTGAATMPAAARHLQGGVPPVGPGRARRVPLPYESFQLDRGVRAVVRGDNTDRRATMAAPVAEDGPTRADAAVRAGPRRLAQDQHEQAAELATEGLAEVPGAWRPSSAPAAGRCLRPASSPGSSRSSRSVCHDTAAPPALWVALALLYEKLGRRDDAIRVLETEQGTPRLTPDAAAPLLRILVTSRPTRLHPAVGDPHHAAAGVGSWACRTCDAADARDALVLSRLPAAR